MRRTNLILRFFNGLESARGQKCKNRRAQAGNALGWNQHWPSQYVRIHAIQDFVFLRNSAGVYHALHAHTIAGHAIEYHARVQRGAFDGRKQFILRSTLQIPT